MKQQESVEPDSVRFGGEVDTARVTLRVGGAALEPDELTAKIGLAPTYAHRAGDAVSSRTSTRRKESIWMLDCDLPGTATVDAQISHLLTALPSADVWRAATENLAVDLVCSVSVASANRGFVLSAPTLALLGQRGIELSVDIWVDASGDATESPEKVVTSG